MLLKGFSGSTCLYCSILFEFFSEGLHHCIYVFLWNLLTLHKHWCIFGIRIRSHRISARLRSYKKPHPHVGIKNLVLHHLISLEQSGIESWLTNWLDWANICAVLILGVVLVLFINLHFRKWIKFSLLVFLATILIYSSEWRRTLEIKGISSACSGFLGGHCQVRKSLANLLFLVLLKTKKARNCISCVSLTSDLFHISISVFVLRSGAVLILKRLHILQSWVVIGKVEGGQNFH